MGQRSKNRRPGSGIDRETAKHIEAELESRHRLHLPDMAANPLDQPHVVRDHHASAPRRQVFVESETIDTCVADRAEAFAIFPSAESLRRVLNQRDASTRTDIAKSGRIRGLSVKVGDE